jgi:hypothetical protein
MREVHLAKTVWLKKSYSKRTLYLHTPLIYELFPIEMMLIFKKISSYCQILSRSLQK